WVNSKSYNVCPPRPAAVLGAKSSVVIILLLPSSVTVVLKITAGTVPSRITSARLRKPHFFTPAQHLPSSLAPFLIRSSRSIVPAAIRDHSCSRRYPRSGVPLYTPPVTKRGKSRKATP